MVSAECRENKGRTSAAENTDPRKLSSRNEVETDRQDSQHEDCHQPSHVKKVQDV